VRYPDRGGGGHVLVRLKSWEKYDGKTTFFNCAASVLGGVRYNRSFLRNPHTGTAELFACRCAGQGVPQ
jgi:hypothetical protein